MELYEPDRSLPRAFICDIDGTLSDHEGIRGHFEYSKVSLDRPIWHIIHVVRALHESQEWKIIFTTGRMDEAEGKVRKDTEDWLYVNTDIWDGILHMRKDGDYRQDYLIKKEIFDEHISPNYWVEFAIDDRNQVVEMWRSIGLPCLQVAPGDF